MQISEPEAGAGTGTGTSNDDLTTAPRSNRRKSVKYIRDTKENGDIAVSMFGGDDTLAEVLQVFDANGDGEIDAAELVEAAHLFHNMKKKNKQLRKMLCASLCVLALTVACIGGMTYGIVTATKDTKVEGRALMTVNEEPLTVSTNEVSIPLGAIAFLSFDVPSKISHIHFSSSSGEDHYYRATKSIDIHQGKSTILTTTAGDVLSWNIEDDGGLFIDIKLASGETWSKEAACSSCTATNVFATKEIIEGMNSYYDALNIPEEGRRNHRKTYGYGSYGGYGRGYRGC